jgi:BirA family biotin operon repressor/biotin-[acetyl-CoA-carboxylase] ligase
MPRLTALAALGICQALQALWSLQAEIKWPNDVLLDGRKVAGILVETSWSGDQLSAVIVGVGVNVKPASVPHQKDLLFPATWIEAHLTDQKVDRWELLSRILDSMLDWIPRLPFPDFIHAWQYRLAYLGKEVQVYSEASEFLTGRIIGLTQDGSLRLLLPSGKVATLQFGEVHLRLVDNS